MSKLKISTVSIDLEDLEKLQILSEHMDTTNKRIFHDYIAMLWELSATFEKFNISYEYYRNTCTVTVTGKNRVGLGIPKGLDQTKVEEAFGYKRDPKTHALIDTTEHDEKKGESAC